MSESNSACMERIVEDNHHHHQQQQHASRNFSAMSGEENSSFSSGKLASNAALFKLLEDTLPLDQVVLAFGYGSGVFSQNENDDEIKMIDFVLVVRDSYLFHKQNLELNPHHYSNPIFPLVRDQVARINWWQRHNLHCSFLSNPGLYYNVTDKMKYGVVHVDDLAADLKDWKYLYLAGRMHKPIAIIMNQEQREDEQSLMYLQQHCNLPAALSTALLLLSTTSRPDVGDVHVSAPVLFEAIASLSYNGDPRMTARAEDPNKVTKLVNASGQLQRFQELYKHVLDELHGEGVVSVADDVSFVSWDSNCLKTRERLWKHLPCNLQKLHSIEALQHAIPKIVAPAARYQSMKGLVTAGFSKSVFYAMRKLSKGLFKR